MATLFTGASSSRACQASHDDDGRPRRQWFPVRQGEPADNVTHEGDGEWLSMATNDTYRADHVRDFPIRCREGTLWVTSPEVPGDTIVQAGEHLSVTSRGTLLVVALAPSSMWIPRGYAVGDVQRPTRIGMSPRRMLDLATGPILRFVAAFAGRRPSGALESRQRDLSQSVDRADLESRLADQPAFRQR